MNQQHPPAEGQSEEDELEGLPPFVSSWNQLYILVIVELVGLIGLFYWFTKAFE